MGFGRTPRTAVAMWDFSWLTRRHGAEAEYADWDKVLDELAERGYDCVRIDAFPHLVAAGPGGSETFTILPEPYAAKWGNQVPVEVEPRAGLVSFIGKASDRGIGVGLSTWLNPDSTDRRATLRTAADFARVWGETLSFLDTEGLLDNVAWVDLCNEFPYGAWGGAHYPALFGARPPKNSLQAILPYLRRWDTPTRRRIEAFFADGIGPLRREYPQLDYTFSWMLLRARTLRGLDTSAFDLVEPHIWLSDLPQFGLTTGANLATAGVPGAVRVLSRLGPWVYRRDPDAWLERLSGHMDTWATWAQERDLPLYTTEAWATTVYDDLSPDGLGGEWEWFKEICAEGVVMAIDKGWTGICTSNFCQPHFPGMWSDVAWHRRLTDAITRP